MARLSLDDTKKKIDELAINLAHPLTCYQPMDIQGTLLIHTLRLTTNKLD